MNKLNEKQFITDLSQVEDGHFYKRVELQSILKNLGLNYSIFSIRDAETWKCTNYECGKRHEYEVTECEKCHSAVNVPIIDSPRTRGGGKGKGHRRYSADDIRKIVAVFGERK